MRNRKRLQNGGAAAIAAALHLLPFTGLSGRPPATPAPLAEPVMVELVRSQSPPRPISEQPPGPLQIEAAASHPAPHERPTARVTVQQEEVEPVIVAERTPQPAPAALVSPALATTAPLSPPSPPASSASSAPADWKARLLAHLERNKRYPASALSRRQQGVAYIRFAMDRKGRVLSAQIERSSGYGTLDREALALLTRTRPLPAPPLAVAGERFELVVPIEFYVAGQ